MSELLLDLVDVTKRYDAVEAGAGPEILRGVTLQVEAGASLAIVGPSGSGKSTLLNLMGGLDRPTSGRVRLDGADLGAMSDDDLAGLRNRDVGFIFQFHHLLPQCTALENVLVPTLATKNGRDAATDADRARDLLDRVGLGERTSHRPGQLSGGECQRVAVVRALINQPKLVLADEPTGSLDSTAAEAMGGLLADLNHEQGVTLVTVTHSDALAARMDRVLQLRDGTLEGAP